VSATLCRGVYCNARRAVYRNTVLFIMPSVHEGFGMPVTEAMVCGARVVLSGIPVFEEIAGADARYIDPMDVEGRRPCRMVLGA
jgi:glycosyltransferase involved in cell wall biosynthesis